MNTYGGVKVELHAFLTLELDVGELLASDSDRFVPENRIPVLTG
jgi:hypothetical protein